MAKETNETYTITLKSPLLRPGAEITTQVSGKYLVRTLESLMEKIRHLNTNAEAGVTEEDRR